MVSQFGQKTVFLISFRKVKNFENEMLKDKKLKDKNLKDEKLKDEK
jgi:hypothetical protein